MMGCHPHRRVPKENANFMAVGWDWDHIGRVMWPKVGREGSFKMIRDEHSREWRPVMPDNAYDNAYAEKWKDAPPFLPPRWIKSIAWECKAKDQPGIIECVNGSKLRFASSAGAPKQGDEIDGWWADEELDNERWISELQRGCVKRRGSGFYSATPLASSIQLFEMHRRAIDPKKQYDIEEFHLLISDNVYIGKKEKETFFKQLLTPQDVRVRWYGEFAMSGLVVYPEWAPEKHVIEPFEIPHYWSRYMIVDPGVQVCAVLFAAVPPEEELFTSQRGVPYAHRGTVHIYDELYIERCTASLFAKKVAEKMGDRKRGEFEAFVIDHSMGRQTELGSGLNVEIQYSDALASEGVYSRVTGSGFLWGSDDIESRTESLRRWMMERPDTGKPTLKIHSRCPKLIWEMGQQFYKKDKEGNATTKRRDANNHAASCFDAETEVLTESGWKRFYDLSPAESLATVNLETDLIEYQVPSRLIAKRHFGEMVKIGGSPRQRLDCLVTPDHRMVVYEKHGDGKPVIRLAGELSIWDSIKTRASWAGKKYDKVVIPKAGRLGGDREVDPGDFAELCGWYVSEGCCDKTIRIPGKGYRVTISQVKPEGRKRIRDLVDRLPWNWVSTPGGFVASSRQLWEYFSRFGKGFLEKRVPQWIRDGEPKLIQRFLEGAVMGDGSRRPNSECYFTSSPMLAGDIQELYLKSGFSTSMRPRPAGTTTLIRGKPCTTRHPSIRVGRRLERKASLRDAYNRPNFETVHYEGMVYCASVPNGTLIVRRNGNVIIAGNCLEYLADLAPDWTPPKKAAPRDSWAVQQLNNKRRKAGASGGSFSISLGPS